MDAWTEFANIPSEHKGVFRELFTTMVDDFIFDALADIKLPPDKQTWFAIDFDNFDTLVHFGNTLVKVGYTYTIRRQAGVRNVYYIVAYYKITGDNDVNN
jgi:hypothetical protein